MTMIDMRDFDSMPPVVGQILDLATEGAILKLRMVAGNEMAEPEERIHAFALLHRIDQDARDLKENREDLETMGNCIEAIRAAFVGPSGIDEGQRMRGIERALEIFDRTTTGAKLGAS